MLRFAKSRFWLLGTAVMSTMKGSLQIEGQGLMSTLLLNDGNKMPMFGLGVFEAKPGDETEKAVIVALRNGYRMIDTAAYYGNESSVGEAIKKAGVKREEVFVVTKLWSESHGYDNCIKAAHDSLKKLNLDYIDLYLIHSPNAGKNLETWDAMVEIKKQGLVRSIGVSNFGDHHLEEMHKAGREVPAVNQIELNPFWRQEQIVEYCRNNGIALQGYCPVFRGRKFSDPVLQTMAAKYKKSVAQLLIRWSVQKMYITIPKSTNPERIVENSRVFDFEITEDDMKVLDSMPEERCAFVGYDSPTSIPWTG